jgi:hypothetical protein
MVHHLVLFQFKEEARGHIDEAVKRFYGMVGKVEVIRSLQAGRDFLHLARSFDLGLAVTFDDRHALEVYDNHPDHVGPVKEFLKPLLERSVSVDFEA